MLITDLFRMGTTFSLLGNNKEIYACMSRDALGCVGALVFSRMTFFWTFEVAKIVTLAISAGVNVSRGVRGMLEMF